MEHQKINTATIEDQEMRRILERLDLELAYVIEALNVLL